MVIYFFIWDLILRFVFAFYNFILIYTDEVRHLALQFIFHITNAIISLVSTGQFVSDTVALQEYMNAVLTTLSLTFRSNQGRLKFELLDFFVKIFSYMTDQVLLLYLFFIGFFYLNTSSWLTI